MWNRRAGCCASVWCTTTPWKKWTACSLPSVSLLLEETHRKRSWLQLRKKCSGLQHETAARLDLADTMAGKVGNAAIRYPTKRPACQQMRRHVGDQHHPDI